MFKRNYLKEEQPSPLSQKKGKASNSILDQLRNQTYTTLAQGLFQFLSAWFLFIFVRFIIVLMCNAEYL
jgi:hypothetical protein